MSEHTPGPWRQFRYAGSDLGICQDGEGDRFDLALVRGCASAEANARLIAAAPDLLLAVEVALEFLDTQNHPRNVKEQIAFREHQRGVLRAAIEKAKG